MTEEYIYCQQCESADIEVTDYEDENGEEDVNGRRCRECKWEGNCDELVSK